MLLPPLNVEHCCRSTFVDPQYRRQFTNHIASTQQLANHAVRYARLPVHPYPFIIRNSCCVRCVPPRHSNFRTREDVRSDNDPVRNRPNHITRLCVQIHAFVAVILPAIAEASRLIVQRHRVLTTQQWKHFRRGYRHCRRWNGTWGALSRSMLLSPRVLFWRRDQRTPTPPRANEGTQQGCGCASSC